MDDMNPRQNTPVTVLQAPASPSEAEISRSNHLVLTKLIDQYRGLHILLGKFKGASQKEFLWVVELLAAIDATVRNPAIAASEWEEKVEKWIAAEHPDWLIDPTDPGTPIPQELMKKVYEGALGKLEILHLDLHRANRQDRKVRAEVWKIITETTELPIETDDLVKLVSEDPRFQKLLDRIRPPTPVPPETRLDQEIQQAIAIDGPHPDPVKGKVRDLLMREFARVFYQRTESVQRTRLVAAVRKSEPDFLFDLSVDAYEQIMRHAASGATDGFGKILLERLEAAFLPLLPKKISTRP
jgi:hypothetical protein